MKYFFSVLYWKTLYTWPLSYTWGECRWGGGWLAVYGWDSSISPDIHVATWAHCALSSPPHGFDSGEQLQNISMEIPVGQLLIKLSAGQQQLTLRQLMFYKYVREWL